MENENGKITYQPLTVSDLQQFKTELLKEMRKLLGIQYSISQRPWLKSHEVQRLLQISPGTLQHLRDSGQIRFSKVGGVIFYTMKDVEEMMKRFSEPD